MENLTVKYIALFCAIIVTIYAWSYCLFDWVRNTSGFTLLLGSFSLLSMPFVCVQFLNSIMGIVGEAEKRASNNRTLAEQAAAVSAARQEVQKELRSARAELSGARAELSSIKYSLSVRESADQSVKRQIAELKDSIDKSIRASGGKGQIRAKGMVGNVEISITTELGGQPESQRVRQHSSQKW